MFRFIQQHENTVAIRVTTKLVADDYQYLRPYLKHKLDLYSSLNLLVELENFTDWGDDATLKDLQLGLETANQIDQLAVVGNSKNWQDWYSTLDPDTNWQADVNMRYFNYKQIEDAWEWLI